MLNKSFFRFFFGFLFIIAVSFTVIVATNYFGDNGGEIDSEVIIAN